MKSRPPEDLFPAIGITVNQAGVLNRLYDAVIARIGSGEGVAAYRFFIVERSQRDFYNLFHFAVRVQGAWFFHKPCQWKDSAPEALQAVCGKRADETDTEGRKPDLLPGFPQGVGQEKGYDPSERRVAPGNIVASRSADDRIGAMEKKGLKKSVERVYHTAGTAQIAGLGYAGGAFDQLEHEPRF